MEENEKSQTPVVGEEPFEIDELDDKDLESAAGGGLVEELPNSGCNGSGCNTGC